MFSPYKLPYWLDTPYCYIPDEVLTVADHEVPLLEQMTPREVQQIDEVRSRVITPSQTFEVDSLFHLRQVSIHQEQRTFWYLIVTTTVCALAILEILCFSLRSFIPCCHSANTTIEPSTVTSNPSPEIPEFKERTFQEATNLHKMLHLRAIHWKSRIIIIKRHAKIVASKSLVNESSTRLQREVSTRWRMSNQRLLH